MHENPVENSCQVGVVKMGHNQKLQNQSARTGSASPGFIGGKSSFGPSPGRLYELKKAG